jgi:hypothetical protein
MRADGTWCITTETGSMYVLDLDHGTVTRAPDHDVEDHSDLRGDCEELVLIGLESMPRIGTPLAMVLAPLDPVADVTIRMTSMIVEIRELHDVSE